MTQVQRSHTQWFELNEPQELNNSLINRKFGVQISSTIFKSLFYNMFFETIWFVIMIQYGQNVSCLLIFKIYVKKKKLFIKIVSLYLYAFSNESFHENQLN